MTIAPNIGAPTPKSLLDKMNREYQERLEREAYGDPCDDCGEDYAERVDTHYGITYLCRDCGYRHGIRIL